MPSILYLVYISLQRPNIKKKSRIQETPNLLTNADSSTNIFVSAGVKKGADSIFFLLQKQKLTPPSPLGPHAVIVVGVGAVAVAVS